DSALNTISEATPQNKDFDPRSRPWFKAAMMDTETVATPPYVFFTTRAVGNTFARRAEHGRAVVGADMTLNQVSLALAKSRATPPTRIAISNEKRGVPGYPHPAPLPGPALDGVPPLARLSDISPVLAAATDSAGEGAETRTIESQGRQWLVRTARIGNVAD